MLRYYSFPKAALARIYQDQSFPVPVFECIEGCAAVVFVLAKRAHLAPEELTPEAFLTFLWILQSFEYQYGSNLSSIILKFTELLQISEARLDELQKNMLALQSQFLGRTGWKIRLDDTEEIEYALAQLAATPGFFDACLDIEKKALQILEWKNKQQLQQMLLASRNPLAGFCARNAPASFLRIPRVFPASAYVTPPPAARRRLHDSPFPDLDNLHSAKIDEDEEYEYSDFEDEYSDFEELEDYEEDGEDVNFAAGPSAAALPPQLPRVPLLGKRQQKPWENESIQEPPRKKLLNTVDTNQITQQQPSSAQSGNFFKSMSRPFFKAFQRHS